MLQDFIWKTFEITGNIDAYVFLKEIEEKKKVLFENEVTEEQVAITR